MGTLTGHLLLLRFHGEPTNVELVPKGSLGMDGPEHDTLPFETKGLDWKYIRETEVTSVYRYLIVTPGHPNANLCRTNNIEWWRR